jgi:hypothetical protein
MKIEIAREVRFKLQKTNHQRARRIHGKVAWLAGRESRARGFAATRKNPSSTQPLTPPMVRPAVMRRRNA